MKWYFDTSIFGAAAVETHPHNARALAVLDAMESLGNRGYVSGHSLAEVYSVLTRTPFPQRLRTDWVMQSLETLIIATMELVTLTGAEYQKVIRRCAAQGWTGGRVFDAVHIECAIKSDCDQLYPFNGKDFVALSPPGLAGKVTLPEAP